MQDAKAELEEEESREYVTITDSEGSERVFELVDEIGYDFTEFFDLMAVSTKAVSTSAVNQKVHVKNPLLNPDTNLKVPDLDDWLNN